MRRRGQVLIRNSVSDDALVRLANEAFHEARTENLRMGEFTNGGALMRRDLGSRQSMKLAIGTDEGKPAIAGT